MIDLALALEPSPACDHTAAEQSPAAFIAATRRRRTWTADYSEDGYRWVEGTCLACGSSVLLTDVPVDHPLVKIGEIGNRIDRLWEQRRTADEQRPEEFLEAIAECENWIEELEAEAVEVSEVVA